MLRKGKADQDSLVALVKDCANLEVEPDGLIYIADKGHTSRWVDDGQGVHVSGERCGSAT